MEDKGIILCVHDEGKVKIGGVQYGNCYAFFYVRTFDIGHAGHEIDGFDGSNKRYIYMIIL